MSAEAKLGQAEVVVRVIAETAVANEAYFCELDAVVGDGDFGYSLARGFGKLLDDWDTLEYDDIGGLLKKSAIVLTSRIGGTSGPIWGTAFLRAGTALADEPDPSGADLVAALRSSIEGIQARGKAELGDKTLLDALVPTVDRIEAEVLAHQAPAEVVAAAAGTAREAAEATADLVARRGRASYSGDRSKGSPDAGAIAVAVILEAISADWERAENGA
jgi:phosphoenolpyruvate---glycerone phosphotransferase subunit DhaL